MNILLFSSVLLFCEGKLCARENCFWPSGKNAFFLHDEMIKPFERHSGLSEGRRKATLRGIRRPEAHECAEWMGE